MLEISRKAFLKLFRYCFNPVRKKVLARKILRANCVRINVGAGGTCYPDWISIEKDLLDITKKSDFLYYFTQKKISKILAEHVIEHVHQQQFFDFLCSVRDYLEPMASIRIAVPDAYHPSGYVRELTKPGGLEPGADDHKVFYSIDLMKEIASKTNYRLVPIEFFDDKGLFHSNIQGWDNGYISRSSMEYKGRFTESPEEYKRMYDSVPAYLREQFTSGKITYTSLIVDFIKI